MSANLLTNEGPRFATDTDIEDVQIFSGAVLGYDGTLASRVGLLNADDIGGLALHGSLPAGFRLYVIEQSQEGQLRSLLPYQPGTALSLVSRGVTVLSPGDFVSFPAPVRRISYVACVPGYSYRDASLYNENIFPLVRVWHGKARPLGCPAPHLLPTRGYLEDESDDPVASSGRWPNVEWFVVPKNTCFVFGPETKRLRLHSDTFAATSSKLWWLCADRRTWLNYGDQDWDGSTVGATGTEVYDVTGLCAVVANGSSFWAEAIP